MQDHAIMIKSLAWEKVMEIPLMVDDHLTSLRFSAIGDFFVATGPGLFNLWAKDDLDVFNSMMFASVDPKLAIPSKSTKTWTNS